MIKRKGIAFRFFFATLLLSIALPVGLFVSAIMFQGHMHPDDWGFIWQDIPIVATIVFAYVFYIGKVILKNRNKIGNL